MTSPLNTTTYNGVDYPVYERGSDFLSRFTANLDTPWFIGPNLGSGISGVRLGPSPQCPNLANTAAAWDGSSFVTLDSSQWSINCVKRKWPCNLLRHNMSTGQINTTLFTGHHYEE